MYKHILQIQLLTVVESALGPSAHQACRFGTVTSEKMFESICSSRNSLLTANRCGVSGLFLIGYDIKVSTTFVEGQLKQQ